MGRFPPSPRPLPLRPGPQPDAARSTSCLRPVFPCAPYPTTPLFTADKQVDGSAVRFHLSGELTLDTKGKLASALDGAEESAREVVVDLRRVWFIDSSGIAALLAAHTKCEERGVQLTLVRPPAPVDGVFRLTGVDRIVHLVD
jgi:anti-sigma B factor antagonist